MSIYPSLAWLMLRPIRAAPAAYTGHAGLYWSNKTEAHVVRDNRHFILVAQVFWDRQPIPGFHGVNLLSELSEGRKIVLSDVAAKLPCLLLLSVP